MVLLGTWMGRLAGEEEEAISVGLDPKMESWLGHFPSVRMKKEEKERRREACQSEYSDG